MVLSRVGKYGSYYGNDINSSNALNQSQMETNAMYIYAYLHAEGWTINAIAGILGNMQVESSLNPGRWQSDRVGGSAEGHGYGLVQWTPYTKYQLWVSGDASTMDNNLSRIMYEINNNIQWIATSTYNFSFKDFSKSNLSPGTLARSFMLCYERPADQSESAQSYRASLANNWYTFLTGVIPSDPVISSSKKKKFKFILFKRRFIRGQR